MSLTKYRLGDLIEQRREKYDGFENPQIRGVSAEGFIRPKQPGADTSQYNTFYKDDFVFNPARMEVNSIVYNDQIDKGICSSLYEIFYVKKKEILLPSYLNLFVKRPEFARLCEFIGWGSAREYCRVINLNDIEIDLPPLSVQLKYVAIYRAMQANLESMKASFEDLLLVRQGLLECFKYGCPRMPLKDLVQEIDERLESHTDLGAMGITKEKEFIRSKASAADLSSYKVVPSMHFACNLMHVGRDESVPVSLNSANGSLVVSPAYMVYKTTSAKIDPTFLQAWFKREEVDRYAWFLSDTSIRGGLEKARYLEVEVPIPDIQEQKALAGLAIAISNREQACRELEAKLREICPILIKGSLDEGRETEAKHD